MMTRAGKAVMRDGRRLIRANGQVLASDPTAPDSPNHLIADDEKTSNMEGNT